LFLLLGIAGTALALVGFFSGAYVLVALGVAMIFGAFFSFVRSNQGTPAPARDDSTPLR
jgi:hypothetical protein